MFPFFAATLLATLELLLHVMTVSLRTQCVIKSLARLAQTQ